MPKPTTRLFVLAGLAACCVTAATCGGAAAQVTVDLHALDAQPPASAPAPEAAGPTVHKPAPKHVPPRHTATKPGEKLAPKPAETKQAGPPAKGAAPAPAPAPTAAPAPPKPVAPAAQVPAHAPPEPPAAVIGVAPPPAPVIPPPLAADAPMAPEPVPPISATAKTTVDTLPPKDGDGVRLDFATGESDLTPGTADAVKALVAAAPKADTTTFNVMAYAAGVPEDPSTARRLSLSRALSVRSALMAYGVPSTHIYVRALGSLTSDGPADRVDVLVLGANAAAPVPGGSAGATPATTATP